MKGLAPSDLVPLEAGNVLSQISFCSYYDIRNVILRPFQESPTDYVKIASLDFVGLMEVIIELVA